MQLALIVLLALAPTLNTIFGYFDEIYGIVNMQDKKIKRRNLENILKQIL